jgi:hypothetical protein
MRISQFMEKVALKSGVPPEQMHLMFCGKQLPTSPPLSTTAVVEDYGIKNESTLHLVIRRPPTKAPKTTKLLLLPQPRTSIEVALGHMILESTPAADKLPLFALDNENGGESNEDHDEKEEDDAVPTKGSNGGGRSNGGDSISSNSSVGGGEGARVVRLTWGLRSGDVVYAAAVLTRSPYGSGDSRLASGGVHGRKTKGHTS